MEQQERRQMILARQHLTDPADRLTVCQDLNGLQAQFLSYTRHAMATRCTEPLGEDWGQGLAKTWTVRGTMHVIRETDLSLFIHEDRRHFLRDVDRFADDPRSSAQRKEFFAAHILACIDRGTATRDALRESCRNCGMTAEEEESLFDSWGGLLRAMSESGQICQEVREQKMYRRCPPFSPMSRDSAMLEQARRYFTHFGPAAIRDAAYYFGCPQRQVRGWLDLLPIQSVSCRGEDCFWVDDGRRDFPDIPDCILVAGFDQLMLGYEKKTSLFLAPEHLRGVFTLSGIVLPCVLLAGEAAAKWKRTGQRVELMAFRSISTTEKQVTEREILRWFPEIRGITWA